MNTWTFRPDYYTQELKAKDPGLAPRVDAALKASWKEGALNQLMSGVFDYYLVPYALLLGATAQDVGIVVSLPHFIAALSQLFAVRAVRLVGDRSSLLVRGVMLQGIFLIPLSLLPLLAERGRIDALIVLMVIFRVIASLLGPAWGSLMSDYLPERRRGEYFGWRSRLIGAVGVAGIGLWGVLLSGLHALSSTSAFVAVFALAAAARLLSVRYMKAMVDMPLLHAPRIPLSWGTVKEFRERLRHSNFARFLLFVAAITFGTQLSVAYFSVYLLRDAHLNYAEYTGVQLASATVMFLSYPLWGRQADVAGNASVLKLTGLLVSVIPLLWFLGRLPVHFMLAEAFSGFVWSGFNLCATNYVYDAVPPSRRVRVLGFYNLFNSMATFLGAWAGGSLAESLTPVRDSPLLTLFLVSAGVRFLANFILSPRFKEVRTSARRVRSMRLILSVVGIRPLAGRNID